MICLCPHPAARKSRLPRARYSKFAILLAIGGIAANGLVSCRLIQAEEQKQENSAQVNRRERSTAEQISLWIGQLNANRFDLRQQAQQKLEAAGQPALDAVAKVAQSGSLESSTRAINILLKWSEATQHSFRIAALEKLVLLTNRPRETAMAARLLANVREQAALESIKKLGGQVTQLGNYGYLEIVIDKRWKGGDDGLKHLANIQRASKISLRVAPISDQGLEHLAKVPQVRLLEIHGTLVSDEAIEKLRKQLPGTIDANKGAMLGIRGDPNDLNKKSVAISSVVRDGAAHKAGLLPGDQITHIGDKKVNDFAALTDTIKKYQPGDTAKLAILRKGKPLEISVTFDIWGATDNTKLIGKKTNVIRQQLPIQGLPMHGLPIKVPRR